MAFRTSFVAATRRRLKVGERGKDWPYEAYNPVSGAGPSGRWTNSIGMCASLAAAAVNCPQPHFGK
jgi:hypothetical protein